jgi:hypothetical protein
LATLLLTVSTSFLPIQTDNHPSSAIKQRAEGASALPEGRSAGEAETKNCLLQPGPDPCLHESLQIRIFAQNGHKTTLSPLFLTKRREVPYKRINRREEDTNRRTKARF